MTSDMWIIFFCGVTLGALIESIIAIVVMNIDKEGK